MLSIYQLELFKDIPTEEIGTSARTPDRNPLATLSFGTPSNFLHDWGNDLLWLKERFRLDQIEAIRDMQQKLEVIQQFYVPEKPAMAKLDQESLDKLKGHKSCITEEGLNAQQSQSLVSILQESLGAKNIQMIPVKAKRVNEAGAEISQDRFAIVGVQAKEANAVIKMCYVNMVAAARARGEDVSGMPNPANASIEKLTLELVSAKMSGKSLGFSAAPKGMIERRQEDRKPPLFSHVRQIVTGRSL